MSLSRMYDEALDLHRAQVRKPAAHPTSYIAHLLSVSSRVLLAGGTEIQAIGALLHDAAEDQGGRATLDAIRERFGSDVASPFVTRRLLRLGLKRPSQSEQQGAR
jgi:(p)ppGpp synthase/HD superfamily hydrolase